MGWINNFTSHLTCRHLLGIGVTFLVAVAVCIGVLVSQSKRSSSSHLSLQFKSYKAKLANIDHAIKWKAYDSTNVTLDGAFAGGKGHDGATIYVCRANHYQSELLPGTYNPNDKLCWISNGGLSYSMDQFELLITRDPSSLVWIKNTFGDADIGAIVGGCTYIYDELYIARLEGYNYQLIGKMHDRYKSAYAADWSKELEVQSYEVLCLRDYAL